MKKELFGELRVIAMKGCEKFASQVDSYLKEWGETDETFIKWKQNSSDEVKAE